MSDAISFKLNGQSVELAVRPDTTVLDLLRDQLGARGTKEGCAEGDCGACSVLLKRGGINGGKFNAANACIMTAAQIDDAELVTVEGLAHNGSLSALQQAMAENGSTQCGFCTPGIVVALEGLLLNKPAPTEDEIHDALAGNLCRCTGYRPIVEAAKKAASHSANVDDTPIMPVEIAAKTVSGGTSYYPNNLNELVQLLESNPEATILAGGTDLGVHRAAYETDWDSIISTAHVKELRVIEETESSWTFGAAVTWAEVLDRVADDLPSFATLIRRFGSTQIRSMGTIGGNIGTASPIGDGPPSLIALGSTITMASATGGTVSMPLEEFFLDYRKTAMPNKGVIVSITVPRIKSDEVFRTYKISKRYDQDISTVCGAYWLKLDSDKITDLRIAYGGMAAIPKRASNVEAALQGNLLDEEHVQAAAKAMATDFQPLTDLRGTSHYRNKIAAGLLTRLMHDVRGESVEVMSL